MVVRQLFTRRMGGAVYFRHERDSYARVSKTFRSKIAQLTQSDALAHPRGPDQGQCHHALRYEDDEDEHGPLRGGVVDDLAGVREVVEGLPRDHADRLAESDEDTFIFYFFYVIGIGKKKRVEMG